MYNTALKNIKTIEVNNEKIYEFDSYEKAIKYLESISKNNIEGEKE